MRGLSLMAGMAAVTLSAAAFGQAAFPMVFVPNNGNLEGGVATFRVNPDGTVAFMAEYVTGTRPPGNTPYVPGTNAYAVALSPSGKYLAVTHATGLTSEVVDIFEVASDGVLTQVGSYPTPDGALDIVWFEEEYLAITAASTVGGNAVGMYRWNEAARTLTRFDLELAGCFSSSLEVTPDRRFLYAGDTCDGVYVFRIESNRSLSRLGSVDVPGYTLAPTFSPDGAYLYTTTGASQGSLVRAWAWDTVTGFPAPTATSPFSSGGDSPKNIVFSSDGLWALVGHGRDSSIWLHQRDPATGDLSLNTQVTVVGQQGSLGGMASVRAYGQELFFWMDDETTDGTGRGLFSGRLDPDGTFTVLSQRVDASGVWNEDLVAWPGLPGNDCPDVDFNQDGGVDVADIAAFFDAFTGAEPSPLLDPDLTEDGGLDVADIDAFFTSFAGGPC